MVHSNRSQLIEQAILALRSNDTERQRTALVDSHELFRRRSRRASVRPASRTVSTGASDAMLIAEIRKMLKSPDDDLAGLAAFALEYSQESDLIADLATSARDHSGSAYVLLQIIVTLDHLLRHIAQSLEAGEFGGDAGPLVREGCQTLRFVARSSPDTTHNTKQAAKAFLLGQSRRFSTLGLAC